MKPSRTTQAGRVAAVFLASSQTPGLPEWAHIALVCLGAVAVAVLGHYACDCPANCPGTDADGNPRTPDRQIRLPIAGLPVLVASLLLTQGCTAPNAAHTPGDTNTPAYLPSPAINTWSNAVVPIAATTGEVAGTGTALPIAVSGIFGLVAAISALIARHKSATATTLAAAVHDAGPAAVAEAMAYASDTPRYAAVAKLLNQQCATGQAPGQPPPSPGK